MSHRSILMGFTVNALVLCAFGVVLSYPSFAQAKIIFLRCGPRSITVDLTKNTVNNLPATIDATSIHWHRSEIPQGSAGNDRAEYDSYIDRTLGTLKESPTIRFANGVVKNMAPSNWSCTATKAPTTKF